MPHDPLPQVNVYHPTRSHASWQREIQCCRYSSGVGYMLSMQEASVQTRAPRRVGLWKWTSWDPHPHTAPDRDVGHTHVTRASTTRHQSSLCHLRHSQKDEQIEFSSDYWLRLLKKKSMKTKRDRTARWEFSLGWGFQFLLTGCLESHSLSSPIFSGWYSLKIMWGRSLF